MQYGNNLANSRIVFLLIWIFVVILQCIFFPSIDGFIAALIVIVCGSIGILLFIRQYELVEFPISTLIILGYLSYYFVLPPIITILEWKSLINNLNEPLLVFFNSAICFFVLVITHVIYRHSSILNIPKYLLRDNLYRLFGFFCAPSNLQLMFIGGIGVVGMVYQIFISGSGIGSGYRDTGNVIDKVVEAFNPLIYIPYCILIREVFGEEGKVTKKWIWLIVGYTIIIVLLAIARNSRGAFLIGISSIAITYIYALLVGLISSKSLKIKKLAVYVLLGFSLSGPLTDLAVSMVIVRSQRTDISPVELLSETITIYQDKEAIRVARLLSDDNESDWDERYTDNLFFSRLSNLKYTDNSIKYAVNFDQSQINRVRSIEWQKVVCALPSPIISFFGLDVDKNLVNNGSGGDFIYATAIKNDSVVGSFLTGSIFGSGYALFGLLYPLVFGLICLVTFPLVDAQVKIIRETNYKNGDMVVKPVFNCLTIATLFSWVFYLTSAGTGVESMSGLTAYILRGWMQKFIIYIFVYWSSFIILKMVTRREY